MFDPFDRKIGFVAVSLVKGRVKNDFKQMPKEHLKQLMINSCFLEKAPFLWAQLAFRYGIRNNLKLTFGRIGKKYGELPIGLELDMDILQWADRNNLQLLRDIFMMASLEALIQVGEKYDLPTQDFREERQKYTHIPNTIEECEAYVSPVSGG